MFIPIIYSFHKVRLAHICNVDIGKVSHNAFTMFVDLKPGWEVLLRQYRQICRLNINAEFAYVYRPQGKVIFSEASVSHSVHR